MSTHKSATVKSIERRIKKIDRRSAYLSRQRRQALHDIFFPNN